ncbi:hypothetical protein D3C80_1264760 [compost metagenome]
MDQDARPPGQERGHDMSSPLARAGAARDQGRPQILRGEQPAAEPSHHAAPGGDQPGATRIPQAAPPPLAHQIALARDGADSEPCGPAEKDERRAARHRLPGLLAES